MLSNERVTHDTQRPDPEQATRGRTKAFWPFKVLGWVAGALSIVNLTKDLNWFTLQGVLAQWVETYQHLVGDVRSFLFGWIHVSWMHVSLMEAHGLVLVLLLMSSVAKAFIALSRHEARDDSREEVVGAFLLFWIGPLLVAPFLALLVPDPWGFWVLVGAVLAFFVFLRSDSLPKRFWSGFALNLVAIGGFALIVLLVGTFLT